MNRWMSDGTEDPGNKLRKNSISESHINTLTQTLNATATYQKTSICMISNCWVVFLRNGHTPTH